MKKIYELWVDCTTLGYFETLVEAIANAKLVEKYIQENPDALEEGEPAIYEFEYDHIEDGIMYAGSHLKSCYYLNGEIMCEA